MGSMRIVHSKLLIGKVWSGRVSGMAPMGSIGMASLMNAIKLKNQKKEADLTDNEAKVEQQPEPASKEEKEGKEGGDEEKAPEKDEATAEQREAAAVVPLPAKEAVAAVEQKTEAVEQEEEGAEGPLTFEVPDGNGSDDSGDDLPPPPPDE